MDKELKIDGSIVRVAAAQGSSIVKSRTKKSLGIEVGTPSKVAQTRNCALPILVWSLVWILILSLTKDIT